MSEPTRGVAPLESGPIQEITEGELCEKEPNREFRKKIIQRYKELMDAALPFADPKKVNGLVASMRELATAKIESEKKRAHTDPLTGALSREGCAYKFEEAIDILETVGVDDECVVIIEFDIDKFKAINDDPNRGHDVADTIMKDLVKEIQERIRHSDGVARKGGDEFSIVLSNVKQSRVADLVLELQNIINTVDDHTHTGETIAVTGGYRMITKADIAHMRQEGKTEQIYEEMSNQADFAAVYQKINGPGTIVAYAPDLKPDLSSWENRMDWATKIVDRELKRRTGELNGILQRLYRSQHNEEDPLPEELIDAELSADALSKTRDEFIEAVVGLLNVQYGTAPKAK